MGMRPERKRVGRPARIDRVAIADAVLELGFDDVTMKRVADHLGVSVPGLYHYVKGREDLLRLAAEQALSRVRLPEDRGQHWAAWLREWARYTRNVLAAQPELVNQFANGGLDDDRLIEVIGRTLDVLHRDGFEPRAALEAWEAVSTMALGAAIDDIRERAAEHDGRPWAARMFTALARREITNLPTLRSIMASGYQRDRDAAFEERLTTIIVGVAVRHRLPVDAEVSGTAAP
jgi:AcrR family transcriptional regulator